MARTIERAAFISNPVPELLPGNAFTEEAGADTFVITDLPFTPSSGQGGVLAHVLRADDTAIAVDGTSNGTTATVTLDADCYHVAGRLSVAIYITDANEQSQCVYACVGNVWRTKGDTELDSGTEVPTLAQLETAYANCVAATAAAQGCVSYVAQTGKTDAEKLQARTNIGAADIGTEEAVYELLPRPMTWAVGSINSSGQPTSNTTRVRAMNIKCPYGAVLTCDPTAEYHMVYHNSDQSVARQDPESGFYHDTTYEIPAGSTVSVLARYYGSTAAISDASPFVELIRIYNRLPKDGGVLKGKKLSVMGDSISAYAGYIPTGADAQYDGTNNGVTSVNQMWWKVLCDVTGMEPLVINGWSGSGVTDLGNANKTPMSDESRTSNLGANGTDPDVIIIEGGSNDFMSAIAAKNEPGSWDGKTAAAADTSFTETYAQMVRAIQTNYPKAYIVALSTCFTNHNTLLVNNGYCWTRTCTGTGNVHTAYEYNEAIRKVAGLLHIGYIDVYSLGENDDNKGSFLADGVHPNRFGMNALAMRVAHELPSQASALLEGLLSRMTGY